MPGRPTALRRSALAAASPSRRWIAIALCATLLVAGAIFSAASRTSAAEQTSTIWGDETPRNVALDPERASVELGTTFTPTVDGLATGVRFYKVEGMSGTHVGTLWSESGDELASVTFADESDSGWQTATFEDGVSLEAGTSYVVSYSVPEGGRYGTTVDFVGSSTDDALSVSRNDSGVFTYEGSSAKPDSTWRSSQYWVDLTFVSGQSTPSPTPSESTPPTATPTPTPTATTPPIADGFPTRGTAGLPAGWAPKTQITGDVWVRTAGAVVEDLRITNGTIHVLAPDVTIRRVQAVGSKIDNASGLSCAPGLTIADSTFTRGRTTLDTDDPVIQFGGYTATNIVIDGVPEGLRVGGSSMGCGEVTVADSYIRVASPDVCIDWHGDAIQGYDGSKVTVRNTTLVMDERADCGGTAPFFYPLGQGNTSVDIDGLLISGGGYSFRNGTVGSVNDLKVVENSWQYGPVDVNCSALSTWQASTVTLDSAGQPSAERPLACTGRGN